MSVVADITVPATSFLLPEALSGDPDTTIEVERMASHSTEWVLPFLWASAADFHELRDRMRADPTVDDADIVDETEDSALFMVNWTDELTALVTEITDQHANILEATAYDGEWQLKLRFTADEQVSTFQEQFAERGRTFDVTKLYHPTAPNQREHGLTVAQYETLVEAVQYGYFDVPRGCSTDDLAAELDISSNAVSQRIRRGCANLVRHSLPVPVVDDQR